MEENKKQYSNTGTLIDKFLSVGYIDHAVYDNIVILLKLMRKHELSIQLNLIRRIIYKYIIRNNDG